jgi:hypothetical protein
MMRLCGFLFSPHEPRDAGERAGRFSIKSRSGKMTLPLRTLCAAVVVFSLSFSASAGVIKSAGTASTSSTSTTTTTSGQRTILNNIDPYNVASFQLDVSFEATKAQFLGITGLNGYIIDTDFQVIIDGNTGIINNIHGYFPGFNDRITEGDLDGPITNGVPNPPAPPAGEVDIFQLRFLDLRPDLDKLFGVMAGPDDYITGFDPATGGTTTAMGPFNGQTGVQPAFSTVPGIPNGGNSVPLPPAIWIGLLGGAGVIGNAIRRRNAA